MVSWHPKHALKWIPAEHGGKACPTAYACTGVKSGEYNSLDLAKIVVDTARGGKTSQRLYGSTQNVYQFYICLT